MRQMTEQAVEAHDISKRFGAVTAVDGLSLTLEPGTALGLLGPNGAGKSTALAMLTGLRAPDTGEVRVFGHRPASAKARARMDGRHAAGGRVSRSAHPTRTFALCAGPTRRPRAL